MPNSIRNIKLRRFVQYYILALFAVAIVNTLRLYGTENASLGLTQLFMLTIIYAVTYLNQPKYIAYILMFLTIVSMVIGHINLGEKASAGILLPVAAMYLYFVLNKKIAYNWLLTSFAISIISLILAKHFLGHSQLSLVNISFKIFVIHLSAFFCIIFFEKFSIAYEQEIDDERTLRKRFQKQANFDELTNVHSRRAILDILENISKKHDYYAIVLIDIDYFKSVNDIYGHAAGDMFLQSFTNCVRGNLGSGYQFGRMGGEEFLVIIPNNNIEEIQNFVANILVNVEMMEILFEGKFISRTCSIGVCVHGNNLPYKIGIQYADEALYQSKLNGRNRCSWHSTE